MIEKICKNCGCSFEGRLDKIFCSQKCKQQFMNNKISVSKKRHCSICNSLFIPTKQFSKGLCSEECKEIKKEQARIERNAKKVEKNILESIENFKDADPYTYVECKICGMKSSHLGHHIKKIHGLTSEEYKKKYNSEVCSQQYSDSHSGENNPAYNHGGKFSPFSKNFLKYDGLTDSEKEDVINETISTSVQTKIENPDRNPLRVEFYISRGISENDAKEIISEKQRTFSLEKCISKHGESEGTRIWQERQDKWMATMNSKSDEEIREINRRKISPGRNVSINETHIADFLIENNIPITTQLILIDPDTGKRFYYDIAYNNMLIEYNGTFWHQDPRFYSADNEYKTGRIAKDKWESDARKAYVANFHGYELMIVWEADFIKDKKEWKQKCINFLTK